jgi:hypothetical protein
MYKRLTLILTLLLIVGFTLADVNNATRNQPRTTTQPTILDDTKRDNDAIRFPFAGSNEAPKTTPPELDALIWVAQALHPCPGGTGPYGTYTPGVSRTAGYFDSNGIFHHVCGNCVHGSHPREERWNPVTNTWTPGLTHPGAIGADSAGVHNHDAARIGNFIYVGGGSHQNLYYNNLTKIDLVANTWTVETLMPTTNLLYYTLVNGGGNLYLIGGYTTVNQTGVWQYNAATKVWTARAPLPLAARYMTGVCWGDTIYLMSVYTTTYTNNLWKYSISGNNWITGATMPFTSYWGRAGIFVEGGTSPCIFFMGGYQNGALSNGVWKYRISTGVWSSETPMLLAVRSHAADFSNNPTGDSILFCSGGYAATGVTNFTEKSIAASPVNNDVGVTAITVPATAGLDPNYTFTPTVRIRNFGLAAQSNIPVNVVIDTSGVVVYTGSATWVGPLPPDSSVVVPMTTNYTTPGGGYIAHRLKGYTALVGEQKPNNDTTTFNFNTVGINWLRKPDYPGPDLVYRDAGCNDTSGHFYVLGGQIAVGGVAGQRAKVSRFTKATNSWDTVPPMPDSFSNFPAVFCAYNNKIYTFSGFPGTTPYLSAVYIFDVATSTWSLGPTSIPVASSNYAGEAVGDTIYVVCPTDNSFYAYSVVSNTFTARRIMPGTLTHAAGAMCAYNGKVYFSGGFTGTNDFFRYHPGADTWDILTPLPAGRHGHGMKVMDNKIYVFGGGQSWVPLTAAQYPVIVYDPANPSRGWMGDRNLLNTQFAGAFGEGSLFACGGYTGSVNHAYFETGLYPPLNIDVGVSAITFPTATTPLRGLTSIVPQATVNNFGITTQTNIAVVCTIFGSGGAFRFAGSYTIPSLAGSNSVPVSFTPGWTGFAPETIQVKVRATIAGDQDPTNDQAVQVCNLLRSYMTGGPDAAGMKWIDSDTTGGPVYNWHDITTTGTNVPLASFDDATISIPLGFTFNYYGTDYTSVWVCTNGFLNFGATGYTSLTNYTMPNVTVQNAIAMLWHDLHCLNIGTVKSQVFGTTPNCTLVVSYDNVRYYSSGDSSLSFQVLLCEGTNEIIVQHKDLVTGYALHDYGEPVTVGIDNAGGTIGLPYYFYNAGNPIPGRGNIGTANGTTGFRAIRFGPAYKDVGVVSIVRPNAAEAPGSAVPVQIRAHNYGEIGATFDIGAIIMGSLGDTLRTGRTGCVLASGAEQTFQMLDLWLPTGGVYAMRCSTIYAGDRNPVNDTMSKTVYTGTIDAELFRITMPDRAQMDTVPFTPKAEVKNNSSIILDIPASFIIKEGLVTVYTGNETAYAVAIGGTVPLTFDLFPVVGADSNKIYDMEARTLVVDPTPANDVKTGTFTIEAGGGPPPTGPWEPMATILPEPSGKNPKSGSCLAGLNGAIYFLKAGGKPDFAKYTPNSTTGTWAVAETLKKGDKLLGDGKYPKKGASMAAYGKDIFVLRGNNTPGFWKYHTDTIAGETLGWKKMVNIPTGAKNPKDASGMTAITRTTLAGDSDYIFTMKGSKTSEFYFYDLTTNLWSAALTAPPTGTSTKAGYKKGSCLAYDEATKNVYVLKGQYGDFFKFNVDSLTWTELKRYDHKTMLNFDGKKKKFGDGAAMVYQDGAVYVLKGGSTYDVWKYNVVGDSQNWTQMGPAADWNIPAGGGKKVKAGGGMTLLAGNFYAVKGANTAEFYRHGPPAFAIAIPSLPTENEGAMGNTMAKGEFKLVLAPNPAINMTAVRYSLPKAGPVRFTLYNVAGSVVRTYANTNSTNNGVLMVDTKALPSGVYILRFTSDELTVTRKLVLQK